MTRRSAGLICTLALLLPIIVLLGYWGYVAWEERDYLQITNAEFRKRVQVGMSRSDVREELGTPAEKSDDDDLWIYKNRRASGSGDEPTFFSVRFQGELVSSLGSSTLLAYKPESEQDGGQ